MASRAHAATCGKGTCAVDMQASTCIMTRVPPDADLVFKALADRTRRQLLDRLREDNGQTLGELCARVAMTRQSATQHLAVLEAANLISTVRRGREKLHYLNPVPAPRDPGALDRQVRAPAPAGAERRQATSGGSR